MSRPKAKKRHGACNFTTYCEIPAGNSFYCPRHKALYRKSQNKCRALRRLLGFCIFCHEKAQPGYTRCRRHLAYAIEATQRARDRQALKRGWRTIRVPVKEGDANGGARLGRKPR